MGFAKHVLKKEQCSPRLPGFLQLALVGPAIVKSEQEPRDAQRHPDIYHCPIGPR